jgi:hypothetical protein
LATKGVLFSEELGIDVRRQPFRWLLAAVLFGGRISAAIAQRTYRVLAKRGLVDPRSISTASRDALIAALDAGGYARYDNITADHLRAICDQLLHEYGGGVEQIHERARDARDLEARLQAFPGIGPVTTAIFLRELRGIWSKADPPLSDLALAGGRALGLTRCRNTAGGRSDLERAWRRLGPAKCDWRRFEATLVRTGLEWRRYRGHPRKRR